MASILRLLTELKATASYFSSGTIGAINVCLVDGAGAQVTSFGGTGGTSNGDQSAFTAGSGLGTPVMGLFESSPSSVTDGQVGVVGITTTRALKVSGTFSPSTASVGTLSNVAENTSNVTVLAANAARLGFVLINDSDAACYVKCGATASATSYSKRMLPGSRWSTAELGINYTGKLDAIWDTAPATSGHAAMRITEFTA